MRPVYSFGTILTACVLAAACYDEAPTAVEVPAPQFALVGAEAVGEAIFKDTDLSINRNQSCESCHDDAWGGTGPLSATNAGGAVYEGSIPGRFGDRKPPSSAYATISPIFHFEKGLWVGGNFWDGRATGELLGNPAADQAQGPFLNPMEQGLPDLACVVYRVSVASYADLYEESFGDNLFTIGFPDGATMESLCSQEGTTVPLTGDDPVKAATEYDNIALAIAAYEGSAEVNAFSSKFDVARNEFTKEERRGKSLFNGKGKCSKCHTSKGKNPAFTDFTYDNLGVPVNPANPFLIANPGFRDRGLGAFLERIEDPDFEDEEGKFKVPTLRNVDKRPLPGDVKAFTHNGYFKSLESLVHFYNTRDVLPECPGVFTETQALTAKCWPAPEWDENVNDDELGDLGLSPADEAAIVAFLKTLTDGYTP
jgi:cytochrome c peroxidase